jgi:hypothetical protein
MGFGKAPLVTIFFPSKKLKGHKSQAYRKNIPTFVTDKANGEYGLGMRTKWT